MENQKLFDKYSDGNHWEKHSTAYAEEFAIFLIKNHPRFSMENRELLKPPIVDLGCGTGRDVIFWIESFHIHAEGFDIDERNIKEAKKNIEHEQWFHVQDIEEKLPHWFDHGEAYFCINVMHYVDQEKVLGEIYRTLLPGGYALIHFNLLIIDQDYSIDYHQKKSDVYELVKKFEIVEEKIFLREDSLPMPHTHHIMQVILKKR